MRTTVVCLVRSGGGRGFLSNIFGAKKAATAEANAAQMTKEQQDKLRGMLSGVRTDEARRSSGAVAATEYSDEMADARVDIDAIRARGVMKYRFNYEPPQGIRDTVLDVAESVSGSRDETTDLKDLDVKFKILDKLSTDLKHAPTNARLLHLKTVADVVVFYSEPVKNVDTYRQMARSTSTPKNVSIAEDPSRFHPEDTHAWHGGVSAFPGTGGQVLGLRNKRILRQFKPKSDWFDYEEQNFDHTRPDKDMPWDPEIAKKMDRYPDRRHNLRTKTFVRT